MVSRFSVVPRYLREKAEKELNSIDTRITYVKTIGPHNHILNNLKNADEAVWQADQWAAEQEQRVALQLQQSGWAPTGEDSAIDGYNDVAYGQEDYDNQHDYNQEEYQNYNQSLDQGETSEWEQYYDESAQAYYWYNVTTGEASWTDPSQEIY